MTRVRNTPIGYSLNMLERWEATRERFLRESATLEAQGRDREAEDKRSLAEFVEREMAEHMDPHALREEATRCERLAASEESHARAAELRRRAADIHALLERQDDRAAERRAATMDTSWVRPILGGFRGESVLDD